MGILTKKNTWFSAGAVAMAKAENYDAITREFCGLLYSDSQWQYYARGFFGAGSNLLVKRIFKNGLAYVQYTDLATGTVDKVLPVRVVAYSEGGGLNGSNRVWVWEGNNAFSAVHFDELEWQPEDKGQFQAFSLAIVGGAAAWSASLVPSPALTAGETTATSAGLDAIDMAAVDAIQGGQYAAETAAAGGTASAVSTVSNAVQNINWVEAGATAVGVAKTVATGVAAVAGAVTAVNKATEQGANAQNPNNQSSYIAQAGGSGMNWNMILIGGAVLALIVALKG